MTPADCSGLAGGGVVTASSRLSESTCSGFGAVFLWLSFDLCWSSLDHTAAVGTVAEVSRAVIVTAGRSSYFSFTVPGIRRTRGRSKTESALNPFSSAMRWTVGCQRLRTHLESRSEAHTPELQSRFDLVC